MPGAPCLYCGAMLDSYGEQCDCPGAVAARTPAETCGQPETDDIPA